MSYIEELQQISELLDDLADESQKRKVGSIGSSMIALSDRLQSIIDRMKAQEPVAWLRYASDGTPIDALIGSEPIPFLHGRNVSLYEHPPADAGMVRVPREPTNAMLEAAIRADREYQERMGLPAEVNVGAYDHWCAMIAAAEGKK